jgi:long-chain acyl-CoA synthetase
VVIHGDRRNYVSALVTLDPEALKKWCEEHAASGTAEELVRRTDLRATLQEVFDELNRGLPRFATVKKFTLLAKEFSEADGLVTPSQKIRRKAVEQRYKAELDAMYREPIV